MNQVQVTIRTRAVRVRNLGIGRLQSLRTSAGADDPEAINALVKVGILLAHEAPEEEADTVINNLLPHAEGMGSDQSSAFCELLAMRGRIIEAEGLIERMRPVPKMLTQLRCLPSRLVRAAKNHREDVSTLTMIVKAMMTEPLASLEKMSTRRANGKGGGIEAQAAIAGLRLMSRTLQTAILREPVLGPVIGRLINEIGNGEDDEAIINAANTVIAARQGEARPGLPGSMDRLVDEANTLWMEQTETTGEEGVAPTKREMQDQADDLINALEAP